MGTKKHLSCPRCGHNKFTEVTKEIGNLDGVKFTSNGCKEEDDHTSMEIQYEESEVLHYKCEHCLTALNLSEDNKLSPT